MIKFPYKYRYDVINIDKYEIVKIPLNDFSIIFVKINNKQYIFSEKRLIELLKNDGIDLNPLLLFLEDIDNYYGMTQEYKSLSEEYSMKIENNYEIKDI
jgi:hypothetical protein